MRSVLCFCFAFCFLLPCFVVVVVLFVLVQCPAHGLEITLCDKVCQLLGAGRWSFPDTPIPPQKRNWPPWHYSLIVESGVKNPNPNALVQCLVSHVARVYSLLILIATFGCWKRVRHVIQKPAVLPC